MASWAKPRSWQDCKVRARFATEQTGVSKRHHAVEGLAGQACEGILDCEGRTSGCWQVDRAVHAGGNLKGWTGRTAVAVDWQVKVQAQGWKHWCFSGHAKEARSRRDWQRHSNQSVLEVDRWDQARKSANQVRVRIGCIGCWRVGKASLRSQQQAKGEASTDEDCAKWN